MKKMTSLILITAFAAVGCSHGAMRGSVAMKTSDNEAHVGLGNKDVKVGDRVNAFTNYCLAKNSGRPADRGVAACEKRPIGEGVITELLNQHYSIVKFDDGVKFAEGTLVEKR